MTSEFIIYCDESDKTGKHFSNFYGGLLLDSKNLDRITKSLKDKKLELNLLKELKWQRVTEPYLSKYMAAIDLFFEFIKSGDLKIRLMFTQNIHKPTGLSREQQENEFTILYYQFIKNGFGLRHIPSENAPVNLKIFLDNLPETKPRCERFKAFLRSLEQTKSFRNIPILIKNENIAEVDSEKHILLQLLDVVLGSMSFRLNDKHLLKPAGKLRRGKRTIAKEKLYDHIRNHICDIHGKHFNVGITTGFKGEMSNSWNYPYSHWLFVPKNRLTDTSESKKKLKNKNP
ncbi:MAG: hypothetical protein DI551_04270 [Micavibrio aeruginosavorus]|uniref:DUF3800 domain-containing protein n=1 Tax=Micavibrio aeruginosavorus TaxID=349221 RepID=A0A2W5N055_9BACT|nr:MAG: hypothetical protein DI551_04270 [Micavibrio aeruginosavorus]